MSENIYDDIGVPRVINAVGDHTRIGGTRMREEALDAMREAGREFASLYDLQSRAAELIAEATGAETGLVTCGATAALELATAAAISGTDYALMERLPHVDDAPNEVLVPMAHRDEYEVAFRAGGGRVRGIGHVDHHRGTERIKPWEVETAITDETAAIGYVATRRNTLDLETVTEIAHDHDVPVIVDAAAQLPPTGNLKRFVDAGADAVAFSGGKAIRGPQTTGILAATREIVEPAALLQLPADTHESVWDPPENLIREDAVAGMPNHGLGRSLKVGKEELAGLIVALETFVAEDDEDRLDEWNERARLLRSELADSDAIETTLTPADGEAAVSEIYVRIDDEATDVSALELVRSLRNERPRVYVGERRLDEGRVVLNPKNLTDEEARYVAERLLACLS